MHSEVEKYFGKLIQWQAELEVLRSIILECHLTEDFKWKHPCYTFENKNIVLLQEFKEYCAVMFPKGALLQDSEAILVQITQNVQSDRQIRFKSIEEIQKLKELLKLYVFEAIEIEKAGLKVKMKDTSEFEIAEELKTYFELNPAFKTAFESLTPGRQRGYLLHFSQLKQSKTRETAIKKHVQRIFMGKGLNDCICGISKRMPNCDGSHKLLVNS